MFHPFSEVGNLLSLHKEREVTGGEGEWEELEALCGVSQKDV